MIRPVELHPAAVREARAARHWYLARNPAAAAAFAAELDRAVVFIEGEPERWPPYEHGTRRYIMRRFPYSVVYRIAATKIRVIAVAHARRKPGYWLSRRGR